METLKNLLTTTVNVNITMKQNNPPQVLSRHLINPNIVLHTHDNDLKYIQSFNYKEMCGMIDFWKMFLVEKYDAKPGQKIYISSNPRYYYYTLVIAAAELGLVLLLDWPHADTDADLDSYKINMWGIIDIVVVEEMRFDPGSVLYLKADAEKFRRFSKHLFCLEDIDKYTITNHELFAEVSARINTDPEAPLIVYASSGTTGTPKKIENSHKKICLIANHMRTVLNFNPDQKILHIDNLHHGASMCYHWLPGFMNCNEHYSMLNLSEKYMPFIVENQINKIYLFTHTRLAEWLRSISALEHEVEVTTIFQITPECLRLIKEKNVKSVSSIFGSTDVDSGILVKIVTPETDPTNYSVANMGPQRGDFFQIEIRDKLIYVACPELDEDWRTTGDQFEFIDGEFYFRGRGNRYRINDEWFTLNELESKVYELFGSDATIVVDFEMQKIYLAIWETIPDAENQLTDFFKTRFKDVGISYVLRNENYWNYFNSRKIDNSKIRERCRLLLNLN